MDTSLGGGGTKQLYIDHWSLLIYQLLFNSAALSPFPVISALLINELICRISTFRDFILCLFRIHSSHAYEYAYEANVYTHTH